MLTDSCKTYTGFAVELNFDLPKDFQLDQETVSLCFHSTQNSSEVDNDVLSKSIFITDKIQFKRYEFMGVSGNYIQPKINIGNFFGNDGIVTSFTSKVVTYEKSITNTKYCLSGQNFT